MASTRKHPIDLTPTPGFCIKSTAVNPVTLPPPATQDRDNVLEPVDLLVVPAGRKVFINICYDKNIPPPPLADEQAIKRAMSAQECDGEDLYYVPVVVSQPREDKDKAGNPSLVFDCVYNQTVKSRALRDSEFKIFLVELALQRIEAQTSLILSRHVGSPNITSKGKLEPRRVWVPEWLATGRHGKEGGAAQERTRLIEEIDTSRGRGKQDEESKPKLKGILKLGGAAKSIEVATNVADDTFSSTQSLVTQVPQKPAWSWRKEAEEQLVVIVDVSKETPYDAIRNTALDIEPRSLVLRVPGSATTPPLALDIDLNKSDAEIVASIPGVGATGIYGSDEGEKMKEPNTTLLLKRQRDFDVDAASAEWRVEEGRLVIRV